MPEQTLSQRGAGGFRLDRRSLIRSAGVSLAALALSDRALGYPFSVPPLSKLIPAEKDLDQAWVAGLTARGQPTTYKTGELHYIGMPVGGITTGQVYLNGDGTLGHWDIFNENTPTREERYAHPGGGRRLLDQKFGVRLDGEGQPTRWLARARSKADMVFGEVTFTGQYPIGKVDYRDPDCPIGVQLEAFSPFVPLDVESSSLPCTVLSYRLTNHGKIAQGGELIGLLENAVGHSTEREVPVKRVNTISRDNRMLWLECTGKVDSAKRYPDLGSLCLALLNPAEIDGGIAEVAGRAGKRPAGSLSRRFNLAPGESTTVNFLVSWCFPSLTIPTIKTPQGRHYATRFADALAAARYVDENFARLSAQTRLWHKTWYGGTLPNWLLERTFLNVSTLATSTSLRFSDGRFYGWEGANLGNGTCTHVWHYEQAMGRIFPELDRILREKAEFNPDVSMRSDGMIEYRGEFNNGPAVDGQAGTILRAYRDHQTASDNAFLLRQWPQIRKATEWLIAQDPDADGILEGAQHNTLDTSWYGPIAWISGLYLAALRAAEEMAIEAGDKAFAAKCRGIFSAGRKNFVDRLFNGEYFINLPDPGHADAINSGSGCEIDQVLGQGWAAQVNLGRVLPQEETRKALQALWRYNFAPDVGPFRAANPLGRWYAMPGEAGLVMCTFPRDDWNIAKSAGKGNSPYFVGYFNECMNGFEHQVAGHMIWEGMVTEGLAIERAVHDRYHALRRNPWNEIEYGEHYARSMASYGVFIAASGFEYHGPKGWIGFAPKINPDRFACAFTAAEGWGGFEQSQSADRHEASLSLKWGSLRLSRLALEMAPDFVARSVSLKIGGKSINVRLKQTDRRAELRLIRPLVLHAGEQIEVVLT